MLTRFWFPFLALVLLVSLLARAPFLIALSTSLLVVLGVANWWQKHSLDSVVYKRRLHYRRAFPGEKVPLSLSIENNKLLPLSWLRVEDPWPKAAGPENEDDLAPSYQPDQGLLTNLFSLRWFERARRQYTLVFRKRGVYTVGPASVESGDLFGIYHQSQKIGPVEKLTVFPSLAPLPELDLPAENPFGERGSRRKLFEDPNRPMGVREYRPEDSFRRVHWPATARTGQLQVKVYQPTSAQVILICLNVSTFARHWEGVYPALFERLVSVSATLASKSIQEGYRVGLLSNGCLANSDQPFRIPPGRSTQQLTHILEALAGVTSITLAPFDRFLMREAPSVPYGATLVVVTALLTPELLETLQGLKRHERRITLISLASEAPPEIPGVKSFHLPFSEAVQ